LNFHSLYPAVPNLKSRNMPGNGILKRCIISLWLGLLFISSHLVSAQQVIWEKYLPAYGGGKVVSIHKADNGGYMFMGYSYKEYVNPWGSTIFPRVYIGRIDENGDTLFIRPTNIYSQEVIMVKGRFQTYYLIAQGGSVYPSVLSFQQFTEDGFLLSITELPGYFTFPYDATVDVNGNILIAGEMKPTPNTWQMGLLKLDPMGNFKFHVGFYPAGFSGVSTALSVENMRGGDRYFLSGMRGSYISSYEIDTNGVEISHKDWYRSKPPVALRFAKAIQSVDSTVMTMGVYSINNIGYGSLTRQKWNGDTIWSQIKNYGIGDAKCLSDGSFIGLFDSLPTGASYPNSYFRKYDKNNQLIFSVPFAIQSSGNGGRTFESFVSDDSGNAIIAGTYGSSSIPTSPCFNFIKIANVGREFDPLVDTINTSVKRHKKEARLSYAIPNPTTGIFHVAGMGSGLFTLLDPQGKILYSTQKSGGEPVDISLYPPGIYTYTLETASSFTSGRVLKEK
jgi:hypothetical protein